MKSPQNSGNVCISLSNTRKIYDMSFSTLILTLNEAENLPRLVECLRKVCDDIIVLDSYSTDGTPEIARDLGCRVFERPFDEENLQRDFGLTLPFKHEWVYNPDADEIPDSLLLNEIVAAANSENPVSAYEVRFRNYLDGRWIRHSTDYPVWVIRFFKPEKLSFDREINLRYVVNGPVDRFDGHFSHYPFSKGLSWWIAKHNQYSSKEAREALKVFGSSTLVTALYRCLLADNAKNRRIALKELSFFLPFRGGLRFLYSYFFRLGFLDGRAGLKYSILIAFYEFMIAEKIKELQKLGQTKN